MRVLRVSSRRQFAGAVCLAASAALIGCSSGSPTAAPGGSPGAPAPGGAAPHAASPDEALRMQRFIDAQYDQADVVYSFRTRFGEDIDCVPEAAHPAYKAAIRSGITAPTLVAPPPQTVGAGAVPSSFDGTLDDNGRTRSCPPDAAPVMRPSTAAITRAGGFDAWSARNRAKLPPPAAPSGADYSGYYHAIGVDSAGISQVTGFMSIMSLWTPITQTLLDHSLSQIWLVSSANGRWGYDANCGYSSTTNCEQTVEAGWNVDTGVYGDGGDDGNGNTHFFTYFTADGYHLTGCYNTGCGYVPVNGAPFTPGQILGFSPSNHELGVIVTNDGNGNWLININGYTVGWYPASLFNNGMGGSVPMTQYAYQFLAGGEVYDSSPTPMTAMGSAVLATHGWSGVSDWSGAAYQRNVAYLAGGYGYTASLGSYVTNAAWYPETSTPAAGGGGWGTYFYYGGPGAP